MPVGGPRWTTVSCRARGRTPGAGPQGPGPAPCGSAAPPSGSPCPGSGTPTGSAAGRPAPPECATAVTNGVCPVTYRGTLAVHRLNGARCPRHPLLARSSALTPYRRPLREMGQHPRPSLSTIRTPVTSPARAASAARTSTPTTTQAPARSSAPARTLVPADGASFAGLGVATALIASLASGGIDGPVPHPDRDAARLPGRARRARPRPHRLGQDARVRPARWSPASPAPARRSRRARPRALVLVPDPRARRRRSTTTIEPLADALGLTTTHHLRRRRPEPAGRRAAPAASTSSSPAPAASRT